MPAEIERYARCLIEQLAGRLTADDLARPAPVAEPPAAPAPEPAGVDAAAPDRELTAQASARVVVAVEPAPVLRLAAPDPWPLPPTAAEHLPSGFIWPVVAGRELARQILGRTPRRPAGPRRPVGWRRDPHRARCDPPCDPDRRAGGVRPPLRADPRVPGP